MSGVSVRDITLREATEHLVGKASGYDQDQELLWSVDHDPIHGWLLSVQDDGGDIRFWKIRLGKLEEEL